MYRILLFHGIVYASKWLWCVIQNNTLSQCMQEIRLSCSVIKNVFLLGALNIRRATMRGMLEGIRMILEKLKEIHRLLFFTVILLLVKLIKHMVLFKIPWVLYLICFDYFDQRRYTLYKSRGVFDAVTCVFLFLLLSYSLAVINMETIKFREEHMAKASA
ncbi:hypothetical protein NEFER03_1962 [Nematocida sp. LUAm3]|nr:hypothetical protein NEFER03_1962 [Nematocida sp. LUAm3]KAI5176046.1 hypothetical protein NEFER02_1880 [Nematocida sp. LUAm2]KAI5177090.1 hypothetical protein NEFER01_0365 [Nematocida sp. LUAm1]